MTRIIAVKYLNTLPFVYGIEESGRLSNYKLELDMPSACAARFEKHKADIALIPVAALSGLTDYDVVTDYCIGAEKAVESVLLVAQKPVTELREIYLDYQSRTTNVLVQVILNKYMNLNPLWVNSSIGFEKRISGTKGGVIIGDRALELGDGFPYRYDLAALWNHYTGRPFVFACWVARPDISKRVLKDFNSAISWGVQYRDDLIPRTHSPVDLKHYYDEAISYQLDERKREAMAVFLEEMNSVQAEIK